LTHEEQKGAVPARSEGLAGKGSDVKGSEGKKRRTVFDQGDLKILIWGTGASDI
jgi:hypothetical protein